MNKDRSGIVIPQHRAQLGLAVWEFLLLYDMITDRYFENDICWGRVCQGKPVPAKLLAGQLGIGIDACLDHLYKLEQCGYITRKRTAHGFIIDIRLGQELVESPTLTRTSAVPTKSEAKIVLSSEELACWEALEMIPGFPKRDDDHIRLLREYIKEFSRADAAPLCRQFATRLRADKPLKEGSNPMSQLRRFFVNCHTKGWGAQRAQPPLKAHREFPGYG